MRFWGGQDARMASLLVDYVTVSELKVLASVQSGGLSSSFNLRPAHPCFYKATNAYQIGKERVLFCRTFSSDLIWSFATEHSLIRYAYAVFRSHRNSQFFVCPTGFRTDSMQLCQSLNMQQQILISSSHNLSPCQLIDMLRRLLILTNIILVRCFKKCFIYWRRYANFKTFSIYKGLWHVGRPLNPLTVNDST